jgi:hypothetical protein
MNVKYLIYLEICDQYEDSSKFTWEESEWDCYTYEELISEYAKWLYKATKNPDYYRNVRAYELKELLMLPDDIKVNKELQRIEYANKKDIEDKKIKEVNEKKEKEDHEYNEYKRLKEKYEKQK